MTTWSMFIRATFVVGMLGRGIWGSGSQASVEDGNTGLFTSDEKNMALNPVFGFLSFLPTLHIKNIQTVESCFKNEIIINGQM